MRVSRITEGLTKREQAVVLIILGLVMGTLFFLRGYVSGIVTLEQARVIEPHYESYKAIEKKRGDGISEVIRRFTDHEQVYAAGGKLGESVMEPLDAVPMGTQLDVWLHSHSNTILQLSVGDREIMSFNVAIEQLESERALYLVLGAFMYFRALVGVVEWIRQNRKGLRKRKKR